MNYSKFAEYNAEKDCYMVQRTDVDKLFQMFSDCLCKDDVRSELESDKEWNWMIDNIHDVRHEHRLTLEKVIDTLGIGKNFASYFSDYRSNL